MPSWRWLSINVSYFKSYCSFYSFQTPAYGNPRTLTLASLLHLQAWRRWKVRAENEAKGRIQNMRDVEQRCDRSSHNPLDISRLFRKVTYQRSAAFTSWPSRPAYPVTMLLFSWVSPHKRNINMIACKIRIANSRVSVSHPRPHLQSFFKSEAHFPQVHPWQKGH